MGGAKCGQGSASACSSPRKQMGELTVTSSWSLLLLFLPRKHSTTRSAGAGGSHAGRDGAEVRDGQQVGAKVAVDGERAEVGAEAMATCTAPRPDAEDDEHRPPPPPPIGHGELHGCRRPWRPTRLPTVVASALSSNSIGLLLHPLASAQSRHRHLQLRRLQLRPLRTSPPASPPPALRSFRPWLARWARFQCPPSVRRNASKR